jgi:uncharacterized membrane protein SpoIIM required for sporulation/ABC-type transport system involved in multi-copper enzyme maturation permease subunit
MATLASPVEQAQDQTSLHHRVQVLWWNLSRALIVTRREVLDMFRDWRIIVPAALLTMIFPYIANWGAGRMVRWVQEYGADIVGERLVPFLLMVVGFFPITFSLVIALETFVGEKERRSLEPLLSTPLTNTQLYLGKTLSATIPPVAGSLLGITVYLLGVKGNINWAPPTVLLIQVILLTVLQALVMVSGAVIVSGQTTSVRAANLLASFIIIPMSFLIQAEALIMFWAEYGALWWIIVGLVVLDIVLTRMGVRIFNREGLLGKEMDELNLGLGIKKLVRLALARRREGPHRNAWQWYRDEVLGTVGRSWGAILLVVGALVGAYLIGLRYADVYRIPPHIFIVNNWYQRFLDVLGESGLHGVGGVLLVLLQNWRVLAVASLLAVFSFGVLAVLILMVPVALVGYLVSQMVMAGMDPMVLWAALIPHSIIELPAAILAGAVAVRVGASILAPPPGRTVGEGWLEALADAGRLWVTLILPLLVIAAVVEVYVTPYLVGLVAGGG